MQSDSFPGGFVVSKRISCWRTSTGVNEVKAR
jgi:hypothetical protein